jgi:hypothetical protein
MSEIKFDSRRKDGGGAPLSCGHPPIFPAGERGAGKYQNGGAGVTCQIKLPSRAMSKDLPLFLYFEMGGRKGGKNGNYAKIETHYTEDDASRRRIARRPYTCRDQIVGVFAPHAVGAQWRCTPKDTCLMDEIKSLLENTP